MVRRTILAIALTATVCAVPVFAGGQATIKMKALPASIRSEQPVNVEFTVHDAVNHPMNDLSPLVVASRGSERVQVKAARAKTDGAYQASVAFPVAGEWTVTVDSQYCGNTCVKKGIKVMAAK